MSVEAGKGSASPAGDNSRKEFIYRTGIIVLILAAVGGAILLFWRASEVFLLLFAGVLFSIFLYALAEQIRRLTHLPHGVSLALGILGLIALFAGVGWLVASPVSEQFNELSKKVPQAVGQFEKEVQRYSWGKAVLDRLPNLTGNVGAMLTKVTGLFSVTIESILGVLVILFVGIYLAAEPQRYIDGFIELFPRRNRMRVRIILEELATGLKRWIWGQLLTMTLVGLATWIGLMLLGVPLSGLTGVVAGILDFIPVVGPWVAGMLAGLLAILKEPITVLYVAILFIAIHFLESHLLIPQVQKYTTRLPPVLTVLALVLFTKLFGFLGLFLATPLLVVVLILVQTMYKEDVLHEPYRDVTGQS